MVVRENVFHYTIVGGAQLAYGNSACGASTHDSSLYGALEVKFHKKRRENNLI